ncbi:MAG: beta-1,3-glucanase family protein [Acidobacteriota bacterium]|nr:beta-1,3-glucanase family protein [Acidobacteriota bacterium]
MSIPNGSMAIANKTGATLHVYDFKYLNGPKLEQHITIDTDDTRNLAMSELSGMRVYFSNETFPNSLEKNIAPDIFNPQLGGGKPFSFIEYTYLSRVYTVDISIVDTLSYPLVIGFDNQPGAWGIQSMSKIVEELEARGKPWNHLTWKREDGSILRIVAPNKAMKPPQGLAPASIATFSREFPPDGHTLSPDNWTAWQESATEPEKTGWVKAMHAASNGRLPFATGSESVDLYGFFLFPLDERDGQFTNIPENIHFTIEVYPN